MARLTLLDIQKNQPDITQAISLEKNMDIQVHGQVIFVNRQNSLYCLELNNLQSMPDDSMNYLQTEIMQHFIFNSKKMSEDHKSALLDRMQFNTHFTLHVNLVTILSMMGGMRQEIESLLDNGVQYLLDSELVAQQ